MSRVEITINGKKLKVDRGKKILWAALDAGIYIPHLCAHPEIEKPHGGCRLCFVEIEGRKGPVTSCTEPVENGMIISTKTKKVTELVEASFQLILSNHPLPCKGCPSSGSCKLQEIATKMKFKMRYKPLEKIDRNFEVDESHPEIIFSPNQCILCGLCVFVCNEIEGIGAIDFVGRGLTAHIGTYRNLPLAETNCNGCMRCVEVCPVGAFRKKSKQSKHSAGQ